MKKVLLIGVFLIALCFTSIRCSNNEEKVLEDVTMIIKDGTLTKKGATIIITDSTKEEKHTYGSDFRIDKKENDRWIELKTIIKDYGFTAMGYSVDENNKLEMETNWEWLYGELEPGEYRIVKSVAINKIDNNTYMGSKSIYVEFTIE